MAISESLDDSLRALKETLSNAPVSYVAFQRSERPTWMPHWVPSGYSHIAWEIFDPAEVTWFKDDLQARATAFKCALERCSDPANTLLLVFEGQAESLQMSGRSALRNAALILDFLASWNSPLWVTSPPSQWLIEVSSTAVTIGEPLPRDLSDCGGEAVAAVLQSSGTPYSQLDNAALDPQDFPNIPLLPAIPALRKTINAEDIATARDIVLNFLENRLSAGEPLQLISTDGCRFQFALHDFATAFEDLYFGTTGFNLSARQAEWVIGVRRRSRTWIEGIG